MQPVVGTQQHAFRRATSSSLQVCQAFRLDCNRAPRPDSSTIIGPLGPITSPAFRPDYNMQHPPPLTSQTSPLTPRRQATTYPCPPGLLSGPGWRLIRGDVTQVLDVCLAGLVGDLRRRTRWSRRAGAPPGHAVPRRQPTQGVCVDRIGAWFAGPATLVSLKPVSGFLELGGCIGGRGNVWGDGPCGDPRRMGICGAWAAAYGLRDVGLRTLRFSVSCRMAADAHGDPPVLAYRNPGAGLGWRGAGHDGV